MGLLFGCGLCCSLLSVWAIFQLIAMGIFFKMEVIAFIEEAEPDHHAYDDFDDFMKQTKENYQKIGLNCWVAASIYILTLALSYKCIKISQKAEKLAVEKAKDDELFCTGKPKKS